MDRCLETHAGAAPSPAPIPSVAAMQAWLAPDGKTLLGDTGAGAYVLTSIGGASTTTVRGLMSADTVSGWSSDVRSVVVNAGNAVPARVESVDVATGIRTFLREIAPPDRDGVWQVTVTQWLDHDHVYHYSRNADAIFVVKEKT